MERRTLRALGQGLLFGVIIASSVAQAGFKWVDEKGITHFSQFPPPGRDVQVINTGSARPAGDETPPPQPATPAPAPKAAPEKSAEQAAQEQKLEAMRQENCRRARSNLNTLTTGGRLRYTDAQGVVRFLTDEERKQRTEEAQGQVDEFCKE